MNAPLEAKKTEPPPADVRLIMGLLLSSASTVKNIMSKCLSLKNRVREVLEIQNNLTRELGDGAREELKELAKQVKEMTETAGDLLEQPTAAPAIGTMVDSLMTKFLDLEIQVKTVMGE